MTSEWPRSFHLVAVALAVAALGCDAGFDPQSEVHGLRVLAVRPEPASGSPGATISLDMLVADGKTGPGEPPRPLEMAWLFGCHNPPSRLYYACIPPLRELAASVSSLDELPPGTVAFGPRASFDLPDDILSAAPQLEMDPIHFGVSYAFFAVCAGKLVLRPDFTDRLPIDCVDPNTGASRGASDFVVGFTTLYSYDGDVNQNPELDALTFDGTDVPDLDCVDDPGCLPRVSPCVSADRGKCPVHRVAPHVTAGSIEAIPGGSEILWASYYATAGEFTADTQLVSDKSLGQVGDYSGSFRAPASPVGVVRLWVTVNDQRGGAVFRSFDVNVE